MSANSLRARKEPVARRPRTRGCWAIVAAILVGLAAAARARAQIVSELEPERPISIEDAHPIAYRAFAASADWTQNWRDTNNDYGPGFSLLYGAARSLELGAAVRWVTNPDINSERGISSGDLMLHALYGVHDETPLWPALAIRVGVQFPTGLDSKGTDLRLGGLATRTFDSFRLHFNFLWTRLGATGPNERKDRLEAIAGMDFMTSSRGLTDSMLVADVAVRSNPVRDDLTVVTVEAGERLRIGSQTVFFAGAGSDLTGETDRAKFRLRVGFTFYY